MCQGGEGEEETGQGGHGLSGESLLDRQQTTGQHMRVCVYVCVCVHVCQCVCRMLCMQLERPLNAFPNVV